MKVIFVYISYHKDTNVGVDTHRATFKYFAIQVHKNIWSFQVLYTVVHTIFSLPLTMDFFFHFYFTNK